MFKNVNKTSVYDVCFKLKMTAYSIYHNVNIDGQKQLKNEYFFGIYTNYLN